MHEEVGSTADQRKQLFFTSPILHKQALTFLKSKLNPLALTAKHISMHSPCLLYTVMQLIDGAAVDEMITFLYLELAANYISQACLYVAITYSN